MTQVRAEAEALRQEALEEAEGIRKDAQDVAREIRDGPPAGQGFGVVGRRPSTTSPA
ncbi:hypothetical protein [Streptomyces sp. HPF1205]|uniref:hypothetical protein n=1 Tax=Streptomyces sp. HPF1205 TaxID=2873262 RepID=UPI001CED7D3A|nr:hypothetical protein [Streptomyces sp. HPF1205]